MPNPYSQPVAPAYWLSLPGYVEQDEFESFPLEAIEYVKAHKVWSLKVGQAFGEMPYQHHNWIKWLLREQEADSVFVPGVTINGESVRRDYW